MATMDGIGKGERMSTPICERAIEDALHHGNALLKFISPNNVGITGSHQYGYYLPKAVWEMYTPHRSGKRAKRQAPRFNALAGWSHDQIRHHLVRCDKTRSEYRLTCFGRDFPFLNEEWWAICWSSSRKHGDEFLAYVLDYDDDIEEIQTALGVEAFANWGIYQDGIPQKAESEDECIDRRIREFSAALTDFPTGEVFSRDHPEASPDCLQQFQQLSGGRRPDACYQTEYQVFQSVERQVCQNEVADGFSRALMIS